MNDDSKAIFILGYIKASIEWTAHMMLKNYVPASNNVIDLMAELEADINRQMSRLFND